ncbi:MAG: methylmalonyl-CoA epimerase [Chloroflexi bacterium]|nr:methylmalonyl-CoA epimerase [Chloroflexota bacterium]
MAATESLGLSRIGQIAVTVHDLVEAEAFYRDRLGMRHLFTVPGMAFFDCDGVRLMLALPEAPEFDHPSSLIYFTVPDIQAARRTFGDRGVTFVAEPHLVAKMPSYDLWMAGFRDCDGNYLCLMSEVGNDGR